MASGEQQLTHNEIWDDSGLINSWDEALEEYKKYHSIHKKGGNVNDLLKPKLEGTSDAKQGLKEADEYPEDAKLETASEMREDNLNDGREAGNTAAQNNQPHVPGMPPAPAGLLGTVRDEGLKRLLMSWYYAGYYTGYYEGQHEPPANQSGSGS